VLERDKSVISRHLRNVFREGELDRRSTVASFATVQNEGGRRVERQVEYFNLDAILSVGYRVNSLRGTQFRIWATQVLRDHLVRGYSVNAKRLKELQQSLKLVGKVLERYDVTSDQARELLRVLTDYAFALDLLDDYDHQRVSVVPLNPEEARGIDYDEAMTVIRELRRKFGGSDLFGREKDQSLRGSLGGVMQSFDNKDRIRVWRKRPRISSIFLSRITVLWTETSALPPPCFSGLWRRTVSFTAPTVPDISPTTRWSPSR